MVTAYTAATVIMSVVVAAAATVDSNGRSSSASARDNGGDGRGGKRVAYAVPGSPAPGAPGRFPSAIDTLIYSKF